eukprot:5208080-Pleurochrysis_carterae.AAC.1
MRKACVSVRRVQVRRTPTGRTRSRARRCNSARQGQAKRCADCRQRSVRLLNGVGVPQVQPCIRQWLVPARLAQPVLRA